MTGGSKELLEREVVPIVEEFLRERGLELSKEKTRVVHITEGFDFLGQNVRKYGTRLLIKPAKKNVQSVLTKVQDFLRTARAYPQEAIITNLNPILRGWGNFHRHIVAKHTFGRVDHAIWIMLRRWARRRHPQRRDFWIMNRYFRKVGTQKWVFAPPSDGKGTQKIVLFKIKSIPIRRHIKIRKDANPFDPTWTEYFEKREQLKKETKGRISLLEQVQDAAHSLFQKAARFLRKKGASRKA